MIPGSWKDATITYLTDADLTAAVDLGRDYETLLIQIPTIDSSTLILHACETLGGTYYPVGNSVSIAASTGGFTDVWDIGGVRYIKIETGTDQTANRTFRVRGVRS